jgi:hypothetical protein
MFQSINKMVFQTHDDVRHDVGDVPDVGDHLDADSDHPLVYQPEEPAAEGEAEPQPDDDHADQPDDEYAEYAAFMDGIPMYEDPPPAPAFGPPPTFADLLALFRDPEFVAKAPTGTPPLGPVTQFGGREVPAAYVELWRRGYIR